MLTAEPMAKILYTRRFRDAFGKCLRRKPNEVKIVVPYFGKTPFGGIVAFARSLRQRGCIIRLITSRPNGGNSRISPNEALELVRMGVDLIICRQPPLHAKIYQFYFLGGKRSGFVGSANFSAGGFENNNETVAFFESDADNNLIEKEIVRISCGGFPYNPYLPKEQK